MDPTVAAPGNPFDDDDDGPDSGGGIGNPFADASSAVPTTQTRPVLARKRSSSFTAFQRPTTPRPAERRLTLGGSRGGLDALAEQSSSESGAPSATATAASEGGWKSPSRNHSFLGVRDRSVSLSARRLQAQTDSPATKPTPTPSAGVHAAPSGHDGDDDDVVSSSSSTNTTSESSSTTKKEKKKINKKKKKETKKKSKKTHSKEEDSEDTENGDNPTTTSSDSSPCSTTTTTTTTTVPVATSPRNGKKNPRLIGLFSSNRKKRKTRSTTSEVPAALMRARIRSAGDVPSATYRSDNGGGGGTTSPGGSTSEEGPSGMGSPRATAYRRADSGSSESASSSAATWASARSRPIPQLGGRTPSGQMQVRGRATSIGLRGKAASAPVPASPLAEAAARGEAPVLRSVVHQALVRTDRAGKALVQASATADAANARQRHAGESVRASVKELERALGQDAVFASAADVHTMQQHALQGRRVQRDRLAHTLSDGGNSGEDEESWSGTNAREEDSSSTSPARDSGNTADRGVREQKRAKRHGTTYSLQTGGAVTTVRVQPIPFQRNMPPSITVETTGGSGGGSAHRVGGTDAALGDARDTAALHQALQPLVLPVVQSHLANARRALEISAPATPATDEPVASPFRSRRASQSSPTKKRHPSPPPPTPLAPSSSPSNSSSVEDDDDEDSQSEEASPLADGSGDGDDDDDGQYHLLYSEGEEDEPAAPGTTASDESRSGSSDETSWNDALHRGSRPHNHQMSGGGGALRTQIARQIAERDLLGALRPALDEMALQQRRERHEELQRLANLQQREQRATRAAVKALHTELVRRDRHQRRARKERHYEMAKGVRSAHRHTHKEVRKVTREARERGEARHQSTVKALGHVLTALEVLMATVEQQVSTTELFRRVAEDQQTFMHEQQRQSDRRFTLLAEQHDTLRTQDQSRLRRLETENASLRRQRERDETILAGVFARGSSSSSSTPTATAYLAPASRHDHHHQQMGGRSRRTTRHGGSTPRLGWEFGTVQTRAHDVSHSPYD